MIPATGGPSRCGARRRRRSRRGSSEAAGPGGRGSSCPGDDELPLIRGPIRSPRLRCRDGSLLATFDTTPARDDRPQAHARIGKHAALVPEHASAVLLVLTVVLLDELDWMPVEDRSAGDMRWEQRTGMWDGIFGGGGDGGGGGGGGDGGGGS